MSDDKKAGGYHGGEVDGSFLRCGWPCRSAFAQDLSFTKTDSSKFPIARTLPAPRAMLAARHYPRTPIWPGFLANTAFYAIVLWLPFGPFVLRRVIRKHRGLCLKCGYPAGEAAVCTECGKQLPGRVEAMP